VLADEPSLAPPRSNTEDLAGAYRRQGSGLGGASTARATSASQAPWTPLVAVAAADAGFAAMVTKPASNTLTGLGTGVAEAEQ
jgi:hypothetical protein